MYSHQFLDDIDAEINHFNALYPNISDDSLSQYYSCDSFNQAFDDITSKDFKIIHINIRSVATNGENFQHFLSNLNIRFDVICLSETWSNESSLSMNHYFPSYRLFSSNRQSNKQGGGVAILVSNALKAELIENLTLNDDEFESVFVKILLSDQNKAVLGCIYRPPNNNHNSFLEKLNFTLSTARTNSNKCIICVDYNYCLFKAANGSQLESDFYDTINTYSLLPLIKKPTRIASRSVSGIITESISIIDNILTNCLSNIQCGLFSAEISDHMPIFAIFKNFFFNVRENEKISFRQRNEQNLANLSLQIANCLNIDEFASLNTDDAVELLHKKILDSYNFCCPIKTKTISFNNENKPWITNEIKREIKKPNLLVLLKNGKISKQYSNYFKKSNTKSDPNGQKRLLS